MIHVKRKQRWDLVAVENVPSYGIGYDLKKIVLILVDDTSPENAVPLPIREPTLNISGLEQLIAVRGQ